MKLTRRYVEREIGDLRRAAERVTDGYLAAREKWGRKDDRTYMLELLSNALYALLDSRDEDLTMPVRNASRDSWRMLIDQWIWEKYG